MADLDDELDLSEDDPEENDESTVIGNVDALNAALAAREKKDHAYVIVIAGPNVGEIHRIHAASSIGRGENADIRLRDSEISRIHVVLAPEGDVVSYTDKGSTNGTYVNGEAQRAGTLHDGDRIRIGTTTILKVSFHDDIEEQFQKRMYESAVRDDLTGAYNKKFFIDRLDAEAAFALRHGTPLTLAIFDLDHFKVVNDTHGHLAGDAVLRATGAAITEQVREEDVFARYGGEEFAVILRGIEGPAATVFGERVRRRIENLGVEFEGESIPVTASVGLATLHRDGPKDATALIAAADDALYEAKDSGRNRVVGHVSVGDSLPTPDQQ